MAINGESLLIAGTLESVEKGQEFSPKLPPHVVFMRWFSFPDNQRKFLDGAMDRLFDGTHVYQHAVVSERVSVGAGQNIPARQVVEVESRPSQVLETLISSMGGFATGEKFTRPYIRTDNSEYVFEKNQPLSIASVALISTMNDGSYHIERDYQL